MKNRNEQLFLQLLQCSLWNTPTNIPQLTDKEYEDVMRIAKRHRMEACIGAALVKEGVILSRQKVAHVMVLTKNTERKNIRMNNQLTLFTEHLKKHGIKYFVVKGQAVGTYYPSPLIREPGDIDIYFPYESYSAAIQLAEKLGMTVTKEHEKGKHLIIVKEDVVFEFHYRLLLFVTAKHRRQWEKFLGEICQGESVMINDYSVDTLPICHHLVYVFLHLFFHLITSGVGLRQLCDMAILLKEYSERGTEWQKITAIVEVLGVDKAFRAVVACCVMYMGVSTKIPFTLRQRDYRWGNRIFRHIIDVGNFGGEQRKIMCNGIMHKIETGWLMMRYGTTFFRLAPQETLLRGLTMIKWR